jgi:NTE family protein
MNDKEPLSPPTHDVTQEENIFPELPTLASTEQVGCEKVSVADANANKLPPYETVALVLQGGGALGAYQAGVYQGLHEAGIRLSCLSGISIGALNTAIIAGNPPETQIQRLAEFWETICQPNYGYPLNPAVEQSLFEMSDTMREALSYWHASNALLVGQKGFYAPRFPPPFFSTQCDPSRASFYDSTALKATLERLCDFDRINSGEHEVSVGAVNVRTGNFIYFDNNKTTLRAEHFMASGALPPSFAPVEIDGESYWDGGLVSNTPLQYVLETRPLRDTLVFQVDLWNARGRVPGNMSEVEDRAKEIRYSSRTRMITDQLRWTQYLRHVLLHMLEDIPAELRAQDPYVRMAEDLACNKRYNVVHLIYRDKPYEQHYKDYEFGLASMQEHWASGLVDIRKTLSDPARLAMPQNASGFVTHDIHGEEIKQMLEAVSTRGADGAS